MGQNTRDAYYIFLLCIQILHILHVSMVCIILYFLKFRDIRKGVIHNDNLMLPIEVGNMSKAPERPGLGQKISLQDPASLSAGVASGLWSFCNPLEHCCMSDSSTCLHLQDNIRGCMTTLEATIHIPNTNSSP